MSLFTRALTWHRNGIGVSGSAVSVRHTEAILQELDEAILLLRAYNSGPKLGGELPDRVKQFCYRHPNAPYSKPSTPGKNEASVPSQS